MKRLKGKILWWSERDQNGIIRDHIGNEFYFDSSVLTEPQRGRMRSGTPVTYGHNESVKGCLCARAVKQLDRGQS